MVRNLKIKDIAVRAGVSTATVSRILNRKIGHSPATAMMINNIISEMEAENAMEERIPIPDCIGILLCVYRDFLYDEYPSALMTAIAETLSQGGCTMHLLTVSESRMNLEYVRKIVSYYHIKGLIVPAFDYLYELCAHLPQLNIPVVCIGRAVCDQFYQVTSDGRRAGSNAADYLWSRGHRRFGIIRMAQTNNEQRLRSEGFHAKLAELGNTEKIWCWEFRNTSDPLFPVVTEILNASAPPTAIFMTNSTLCRQFVDLLHRNGLRIPEEISLLSIEENGELYDLGITCLAQPVRQIGETAAKMLLKKLYGTEPRRVERFDCSLKERNSVANRNIKLKQTMK